MKVKYRILCTCVCSVLCLMWFSACERDNIERISGSFGSFVLRAEDKGMSPVSRAGGDKYFVDGTRYVLWGIREGVDNAWISPYVKAESIISRADGELEQTKPNTYENKAVLNFYALTWGCADSVPQCTTSGENGEALFEHVRDNGVLPDLRRAERTGCTAANTGERVVLPFRHTLVKLGFEVVRQKAEESLDGAKITSIKIHDHQQGTLNVETGGYTYNDSELTPYEVCLKGGVEVTEKMETVKDANGKPLETLVFPNKEDEYLTVSVIVEKKDGKCYTTEYQIPTAIIVGGELVEKPFRFLANHEYVLQLTVMTDQVRIIAIVPQKYDWIEVPDTEQSVGNPVVFANAMWLDRNLGAQTYDINSPEDFEKSVGYFYQTCRNVPYWPFYKYGEYRGGAPHADERYNVSLLKHDDSWGNSVYYPYPVVSDRLWQYVNVGDNWVHQGGDNIYEIQEPEDAQKNKEDGCSYSFHYSGDGDKTWWQSNNDWNHHAHFWNKIENQPVPAGWAIPTKAQFMTIFPSTPFAGNWAFIRHGNNSTPSNWNEGNLDKKDETLFPNTVEVIRMCVPYYKDSKHVTFWQNLDNSKDERCIPHADEYMEVKDRYYFRPDHDNNKSKEPDGDPAPGYYSVYIISRQPGDEFDFYGRGWKGVTSIGTIYGIKKVGTSEAYRMRWKVFDVASKEHDAPLFYVQVNVYPASAGDNLTVDNFHEFDWEHPASTMNFPVSGMIGGKKTDGGKFFNCGSEVIYATSEVSGSMNSVLRIKLWGDVLSNIYLSVVDDAVNHGKQLRLIRDDAH